MSLAIYITLGAAGIFTAEATKGERLMLTLWGILVSVSQRLAAGLLVCFAHAGATRTPGMITFLLADSQAV